MTTTRIGAPGVYLPATAQLQIPRSTTVLNQGAGAFSLPAGASELIPPGQWMVQPGPYSFVQIRDPISQTWQNLGTQQHGPHPVLSDGVNFRVANLTGCAVGAFITNVGSGYTSAPTVTASAGGSTWRAIVGGAINTTVTITTAGTNYTYAPTLIIGPPPQGGVQATATCTVSGGAINAVTVVNQGAGYTTVPPIYVVPDPRDTTGSGAVLTATLTGSGTIAAIVRTDHGTALTSVPTLTISGGGGSSAAATVVMCWTVTGYTVGTAGAVYGNAQPILTLAVGGIVGGSAGAIVNPQLDRQVFMPRQGSILSTSTAGGALTTGGTVQDGGLFQAAPTSVSLAGNSIPTTQAVATLTMGGVTDTSWMYQV